VSKEQLYSSVLVKIGVERNYLLSKVKLEQFADVKTLSELNSLLKETTYGENLAKIESPYIVNDFETAFWENFIEVCIKIVRNSPEIISSFLRTYLLKFEHENIKTILRGVSIGLQYDEISGKLYIPVETFLKRPKVILKAAKEIQVKSVVDVLQTTFYGPLLRSGLKNYDETGSTKYFDILLDRMFYEYLGKTFKELPTNEQKFAFFYVSSKNDEFNIVTILRAKLLGYEPHWIRMVISPKSYNIPEQLIEKMLMADNFESAFSIVKQTYYKDLFTETQTPEETIFAAEKAFEFYRLEHAKKTRISDPFNVGSPISFIIKKEIEVFNLISISLGIQYNWKRDEILSFLLF
jgi:vacuolar-type H+-ATPase subunit C/Vma6